MNTIDFAPLYRSVIGFDRLASLLDSARLQNQSDSGYPPYNIEAVDDKSYTITVAVGGFEEAELDVQVEKGVLTISGRKAADAPKRNYLYQGIAARAFERKFQLADAVQVVGAELRNGLLTVNLVKEIPEAMKPRRIAIGGAARGITQEAETRPSEEAGAKAA